MIEKLKLEPYIPESLVVHLYSHEGHLVAERYDTIYWVRDEFHNVACGELDCFVDAKLFCAFAQSIKKIVVKDSSINLVLFNGAKYDLELVKGENIPTFKFGELAHKSAFDFGGVESATSKSPLQKELNTVYVDCEGCVASDEIVAGVSTKFKSDIPFAVPEGIHGMLNGAEAEWDIIDGNLYIAFGAHKIVATLSHLPEFKWWEVSRAAFEFEDEEHNKVELPFTDVTGLKSSLGRLSNFGSMLYIRGGRLAVNKDHWEPFVLDGDGETFDISNLNAIAVDDKVGVALVGGNLYLKTSDAMFVCCAVDVSGGVQEDFDPDDTVEIPAPAVADAEPKAKGKKKSKKK